LTGGGALPHGGRHFQPEVPVTEHAAQLIIKYFKDVGIDSKLDQKEYGAYISTCFYGKFDSLTYGPQTPFLEPDNFLFGQYYPGETKNQSHINDPVVADMLIRQRRSGRSYMQRAPWMAIFPGLAISLAVFGFNMLGDALRDVLDPRLRGTGTGR
jgi:hypothetical protein